MGTWEGLLNNVKVPAGDGSDDSEEEPLFHDGLECNDRGSPRGNEEDDDGEDGHGDDSSDGALVASPSASSSDSVYHCPSYGDCTCASNVEIVRLCRD